jgi:hypothetical protein
MAEINMPQYLFTICTGHQSAQTKRVAELNDDAAALAYASASARAYARQRAPGYQLVGEDQ